MLKGKLKPSELSHMHNINIFILLCIYTCGNSRSAITKYMVLICEFIAKKAGERSWEYTAI